MEISLKVIFYLFFFVIIIFPQNSVTSSTNLSVFNDIMNDIVNDCYKDLENIFIFEHLDNREDTSAINPIVKTKSVKYIRNKFTRTPHYFTKRKIDAYFIFTNTSSIFGDIVISFRAMNSWTNTRPIFIFATNDDNNHTSLFDSFWNKWSLLNFYYIYANSEGRVSVLTSNPYGPYASEYWQLINIGTEKSVFYRRYSKGKLCQGFVFDRTKDLTQVRLLFISKTHLKGDYYRGRMQVYCSGHWHDSLSYFEIALKVKIDLYCAQERLFNKQTAIDFLYTKPDLYYSSIKDRLFEQTFPPVLLFISAVSHNQGYQTIFEQMYNLFGKWIILYTCCLLTITFIVCFYFAKTDRVAFATFEVIRLLINASLRTNINTPGLKIFFLMLFFYFLIIQSMFQGKLAGFLTNPSTRKNADTLDDLESSAYKKILHVTSISTLTLNQKVSNKSSKIKTLNEAMNILKNDTSVVIVDNIFNIGIVLKYCPGDLYVSKEPISSHPLSYTMRKGNPLNERINKLLLSLHELGFSDLHKKTVSRETQDILDRLKSISLTKSVNKPIDMKSIMPLVIFLASGLVTAVICFIGEIIIYRLQKSKNPLSKQKNRKQESEEKNNDKTEINGIEEF